MTDPPAAAITAEQVARLFHETYERLAPDFGYKTRTASAVPWDEVPGPNRSLMIAVAAEVAPAIRARAAAAERDGLMRWLHSEAEELRQHSEESEPTFDDQIRAMQRRNQASTSKALITAIAHIAACRNNTAGLLTEGDIT